MSSLRCCAVLVASLLYAAAAEAHVGVNGPALADKNQILTFSVGHGCEGADVYKLELKIPEGITALRALPSAFGEAVVATSSAGLPLSVTWTKSAVREADDHYYQFSIRIRVPDAPFTTIDFESTQYCRTAMGEERKEEWTKAGDNATALVILPERMPGWNKYVVPAEIKDLAIFDDAQIVWAGQSAYSKNPTTMELIRGEPDVEELTSIAAGTEIWVKY